RAAGRDRVELFFHRPRSRGAAPRPRHRAEYASPAPPQHASSKFLRRPPHGGAPATEPRSDGSQYLLKVRAGPGGVFQPPASARAWRGGGAAPTPTPRRRGGGGGGRRSGQARGGGRAPNAPRETGRPPPAPPPPTGRTAPTAAPSTCPRTDHVTR